MINIDFRTTEWPVCPFCSRRFMWNITVWTLLRTVILPLRPHGIKSKTWNLKCRVSKVRANTSLCRDQRNCNFTLDSQNSWSSLFKSRIPVLRSYYLACCHMLWSRWVQYWARCFISVCSYVIAVSVFFKSTRHYWFVKFFLKVNGEWECFWFW